MLFDFIYPFSKYVVASVQERMILSQLFTQLTQLLFIFWGWVGTLLCAFTSRVILWYSSTAFPVSLAMVAAYLLLQLTAGLSVFLLLKLRQETSVAIKELS